jgi:hypothetical protein
MLANNASTARCPVWKWHCREKRCSANFALTAFCEVRLIRILGSPPRVSANSSCLVAFQLAVAAVFSGTFSIWAADLKLSP